MARQITFSRPRQNTTILLDLYLLTLRPYMQELVVWTNRTERNLRGTWKRKEVEILSVD